MRGMTSKHVPSCSYRTWHTARGEAQATGDGRDRESMLKCAGDCVEKKQKFFSFRVFSFHVYEKPKPGKLSLTKGICFYFLNFIGNIHFPIFYFQLKLLSKVVPKFLSHRKKLIILFHIIKNFM